MNSLKRFFQSIKALFGKQPEERKGAIYNYSCVLSKDKLPENPKRRRATIRTNGGLVMSVKHIEGAIGYSVNGETATIIEIND